MNFTRMQQLLACKCDDSRERVEYFLVANVKRNSRCHFGFEVNSCSSWIAGECCYITCCILDAVVNKFNVRNANHRIVNGMLCILFFSIANQELSLYW